MNLKNYTSTVPPERSVSQLEKALVGIGATHISKSYQDGQLCGIVFQVMQDGRSVTFKLPANVQTIQDVMAKAVKRPRKGTVDKIRMQAHRTAWKLLLDWTQVQASMIVIGRRSAIEVFLPYAYDPQREQTFFERLQESKFKMLTA